MAGRKLLIGSVVVVVLAGAAVAGWRTGWPRGLFGSPSFSQPLGPHIEVSQITKRSTTPYRVGSDKYVNSRIAWKSLSGQSRARLISQLHVAELKFKELGRGVFPPPHDFVVRELAHDNDRRLGRDRGGVEFAAHYAEDEPGISEDFGPTAFGDRPLDYGTATYAGASGQWSWIPCASARSPVGGVSVAVLCGGQAFAVTTHLAADGMSVASVEVVGEGAALAAQPALAAFTNRSRHAVHLTVTATAADVSASVRTSPESVACSPASLLYSVPAPKNASSQLANRSQISISSCLDSLDALLPAGKVLKIISDLRTWASFARDAYGTVADAQELRSSDALKACAAGRMLSYIGGVLSPVGVPTCSPVVLPTWTGPVPVGQTVQFAVTPVVEERFFGQGQGIAMLFSFIHLHISESPAGSAPCTSAALASTLRAADAQHHMKLPVPENWAVQGYACQSGYALAGLSGTGYPSNAIYKQQGASWMFVCVLGEFSCYSANQNGRIISVSKSVEPTPALLRVLTREAGRSGP